MPILKPVKRGVWRRSPAYRRLAATAQAGPGIDRQCGSSSCLRFLICSKEPAMSVAEVTMHRDGMWLTAMSRPVGELAGRRIERLVDDLVALAQKANIVVVNLVAPSVPTPATLARA